MKYTDEVKFAIWNKFYNDLEQEITNVRNLGFELMRNPNLIHIYHSRIINMFSSYKYYIINYKEMEEKLNEIEDIIYSENYIKDIQKNRINSKYQREIIKKLRNIYSEMCANFTEKNLRPKVIRTKKYDETDAILDNGN